MVTYYRLAPLVVARFVGLAIVLLAVIIFAATAVVLATGSDWPWLLGVLVLGVAAVGVLAWWLQARVYVVRCDSDGYRVGFARGAGVKQARWGEIVEAVAATPGGVDCLVLRLKNGGTTSIPVGLLALDKDAFAREMQKHLRAGQRVRKI